MYAVVATGGKQYRVSAGDTIDVERLPGAVGERVTLTDVMMLGQGADVQIGTPMLSDASIEAQIVAQKRGKKLIIFKHKRRKGYRRKQGHRQELTSLRITAINGQGVTPAIAVASETPASMEGESVDTAPASESAPVAPESA